MGRLKTLSKTNMLTIENQKEYYQALLDKDTEYEGVFYVGVKTTGIFCRPTCRHCCVAQYHKQTGLK